MKLLPLFSRLFFKVFAVEHVPFPASGRNMAGQRLDFVPYDFIQIIFPLEEVVQNLFRLGKRAPLVGEIYKSAFSQPVHDEMGQMREAIFGKAAHKIKPFLAASFCFARRNILKGSISFAARA